MFNNWLKIFKKPEKKKYKLGIAFGGGGARGFAHLGAIKALEENGIVADEVAGTSAGSIVGALYSFGLTSDEMIDIAKGLKRKDIKSGKILFIPSSTEGIQNLIKLAIGDAHIEDLKKPFTAVAVDLKTGNEIHLTSGSVATACAASCCVPGVFNPVVLNDWHLVDGGLKNNIPASVLKENGCDYVISIDVNPTRGYGTDSLKILDIFTASYRIMSEGGSVKCIPFTDVLVNVDTFKFKSTDIEGGLDMIQIGYDAMMQKIPEIKEMLADKKTKQKLGIFKPKQK